MGCTSLVSVKFADNSNLKTLSERAFGDCTALTSIILPATVNKLYTYAFLRCGKLSAIYFEGTTTEWSAVSKGTYWKSSAPATYVICSNGKVSI